MENQPESGKPDLTWWVDAWGERLVRYAYVITRDHHLAQDVTQETFVKLMVFQRRHPDRDIVPGWLFTTARRVALTLIKRRGEIPHALIKGSATDSHVWVPAAFRDMLHTLPLLEREAVWLFYYQDWSTEQIARYVGCSPGALRGRLLRARNRLRQLWGED